eukprot:1180441-Prorocentrum_minimum.AAC.2
MANEGATYRNLHMKPALNPCDPGRAPPARAQGFYPRANPVWEGILGSGTDSRCSFHHLGSSFVVFYSTWQLICRGQSSCFRVQLSNKTLESLQFRYLGGTPGFLSRAPLHFREH